MLEAVRKLERGGSYFEGHVRKIETAAKISSTLAGRPQVPIRTQRGGGKIKTRKFVRSN